MDVADPTIGDANANLGLKTRYDFSKTSNTIEMAGPLFCDAFFSIVIQLCGFKSCDESFK